MCSVVCQSGRFGSDSKTDWTEIVVDLVRLAAAVLDGEGGCLRQILCDHLLIGEHEWQVGLHVQYCSLAKLRHDLD